MLPESRLYSFIDQKEGFTLHFLEGQKLIHDIALIHGVKGEGFHFFRNIILTTQMLLSYLKPGEGLGIYIDSEAPFFKFKIEISESGSMRSLLLPDDLNILPKKVTGKCRITKTSPSEKQPYTSIINLSDTDIEDVINKILSESYQFKSRIILSDVSDQAIMISKLPSININKIETQYTLSLDEYWLKHQKEVRSFFDKHTTEYDSIQKFFENLTNLFLSSKEVKFKCSCSRERMIHGLWSLIKSTSLEQIFAPEENEIETKCDYCKTKYIISRNEFLN